MTATIAPPHPFLATNRQEVAPSPVSSDYTVAQAAQFLGNSEGYVEELLKDQIVSFRTENGERFVQWDSLSAFEQGRARKNVALDRIVRWDQEMGLYDE